MGILTPTVDPTGQLSPEEVNAQNLSQVVDEINRNSDQLDAITNSLNIINKGPLTGTWDGSSLGAVFDQTAVHGFGSPPIFVAYFSRSDQPGLWYPFPQWFYDNSGVPIFAMIADTDNTYIHLRLSAYQAASPISFTMSYYILQQPAQLPQTK